MTSPKVPGELEVDQAAGTYTPIWREYALRIYPQLLVPKTWPDLKKLGAEHEIPEMLLRNVLAWLGLQHLVKHDLAKDTWVVSKIDLSSPPCKTCNGLVVIGKCRLCKGEISPLRNTVQRKDHVVP